MSSETRLPGLSFFVINVILGTLISLSPCFFTCKMGMATILYLVGSSGEMLSTVLA